MKTWLFVMLGGGLGASLRYGLSLWLNPRAAHVFFSSIPLGTLIANWLGCFTLGIIMGYMPGSSPLRIGLTTGFMGGLTTFSTFSAESAELIMKNTPWRAILHFSLHNGIGILLVIVGLSFGLNFGTKASS